MTTQRVRDGAAVALGLGSGLAVALAWAALSAPPAVDTRVTALERQLARLAAGRGGPSEAELPDAPSPAEAAELEAQHLARWRSTLAEHAAEPIDEPWASEASRTLEAALARLGEAQGFLVVRTDCRTRSCAAALRWPSYQTALDGFAELLHAEYEVACARRITLPEPDDPELPYDGTMLFECTASRTPRAAGASLEPGVVEARSAGAG